MKYSFIYENNGKERLDKFLQSQITTVSRHQLQKAILGGQVKVNDGLPTVHHWLKAGDQITYTSLKNAKKTKNLAIITPKIIAPEKDYIIINKPSGLLVHPTEKKEKNTLVQWLIKKFPRLKNVGDDKNRPGIVHRLDREASGVMVIALNQNSFNDLKRQFQERLVKKEYRVLVHGQMVNDEGEIRSALSRDKKTGLIKVSAYDPAGQEAHTTYQVLQKFKHFTLLKVQILTGRTHQIRAHLYSIGHSVVGDKLYQTKDLRKKKKALQQRIFLHSTKLEFTNLAGETVCYQAPLPMKLKKFLNTLP